MSLGFLRVRGRPRKAHIGTNGCATQRTHERRPEFAAADNWGTMAVPRESSEPMEMLHLQNLQWQALHPQEKLEVGEVPHQLLLHQQALHGQAPHQQVMHWHPSSVVLACPACDDLK